MPGREGIAHGGVDAPAFLVEFFEKPMGRGVRALVDFGRTGEFEIEGFLLASLAEAKGQAGACSRESFGGWLCDEG